MNLPPPPLREPLFHGDPTQKGFQAVIDDGSWLSWLKAIWAGLFGINQTWQNKSPTAQGGDNSRTVSTPYTNNTSKPIAVKITVESGGTGNILITPYVGGQQIGYKVVHDLTAFAFDTVDLIVPPGATYEVIVGNATIYLWWELR